MLQPTCSEVVIEGEVVFDLGQRRLSVDTSSVESIEQFVEALKKMKNVGKYRVVTSQGRAQKYVGRLIMLRKKLKERFKQISVENLIELDEELFWLIEGTEIKELRTENDFLGLDEKSEVMITPVSETIPSPLRDYMSCYLKFRKKMIDIRQYRKEIVFTALSQKHPKEYVEKLMRRAELILDKPELLKVFLRNPPSPEDLKRLKTKTQVEAYLLSNSFWR